MAQKLKFGHILAVDSTTGALFPWLTKTLARLVIFPDGKNLLEHWQEEMSQVNKAKFRRETASLDVNSFNWETNTFGASNAVLKLHTVMSLPPQSGNDRYIYKIALPSEFIPDGKSVDYDEASFSVFERENSTFIRKKCLHNICVSISGKEMQIIVDHLKGIDKVNLDNETYITGSFDITCNLSFSPYLSTGFPPVITGGQVITGDARDPLNLDGIIAAVNDLQTAADNIKNPS